MGLSGWLLALGLAAGAGPDRPCPALASDPWDLPEHLAPPLRAAASSWRCDEAADLVADLYRGLLKDPRRRLEQLHGLLGDAVNLYVEGYARTRQPALVCRADGLVQGHLQYVRREHASTPAFEATIARVRTQLHARLAPGERCATVDAGMIALARRTGEGEAGPADMLLGPGELTQATRDRRPRRSATRRWQGAKRAGVGVMAMGLMMLGGGIAVGAAERLPRRDLVQGGLLVGGTALFLGGFPLLIVADQRVRAALAVAPGGVALRF